MNKRAFIPISALMGALLLAVIAAMTPFVAGPDLAYAQSQSQDTTLYELSIAGQSADPVTVSAFMPAFVPGGAPDADGYSAYATTGTGTVALTANASHTGAGVAVTAGADEQSASATSVSGTASPYTVTLEDAGEDTVVLVKVTAADNIATATYKLTIMRAAADDADVTLSALSLMAGGEDVQLMTNADPPVDTDFATGTNEYKARVPYATASVEVAATPTDEDDGATYAVTSTDADDDDNTVQNGVVSLSEGDNTVTVTVTAADRVTTGTYTVTVTRVADTVSTDTTLTTLSLTDGTDAVSLSPAFRAGTAPASNGYTARVDSGTDRSVTLRAIKSHVNAAVEVKAGATEEAAGADTNTAITPTVNDYAVPLQAEGTDTVILVTVTAEDNASKATYKVTVERAASDTSAITTLSALSIMAGGDEIAIADSDAADDFMPGDCATANACTARVPSSIGQVTVMATPVNRGATYEVESDNDSNVQNNRVDLDEGANVITVTVTAADESTEGEFTVTVTRAAGTDSRVTTLSELSINDPADTDPSDGTDKLPLMPTFDPDGAPASGGYMAYVANTVGEVTLNATASHTGATVEVKAGEDEEEAEDATAITGGSPYTVNAAAGFQDAGDSTVILVTVTGADRFATSTYKVTVMRGATGSADATLSALGLMDAGGNEITIADGDATNDFMVAECLTSVIATTQCTANVSNATMMVEVTATPTDARDGATYAVTSDKDRSVQNNQVDLAEGANVILVTVTGADKVTTDTYTVTVTRVASNLSTDTTLSVLSLIDSASAAVELEPDFVPNSTPVEGGYAAEVGDAITSVTVTATTAHTGASAEVRAGADYDSAMEADAITAETDGTFVVDADEGFQGEGADTVILVTVTAADLATTGTHMITVSRDAANTNDELKSLSLNGDAVTLPATDPTDGVHARVIVDVPSVMVMAVPRNSMAEVTVTSDKDDDVEDNVVDLAMGINVITITVDPVSGDDNTYTIRVRRDASTDASLSSLSLKHLPMDKMEGVAIDLMPMFDSGTMAYSADAGGAEMITVTAKVMHSEAMVSVMVDGTAAPKTNIPMYWDMLGCPAMNDSVRMYDDHDHPDDATSPYCTTYNMDATHPGLMGDAKDVVDMTFADYYDVPLMAGQNKISVMVTAEDGIATETYTVEVSRVSDDATLASLSLTDMDGMAISLTPEFASDMADYAAMVYSDVEKITIMPVAMAGATYDYWADADTELTDVDDTMDGDQFDLMVGENTIIVRVIAEDGTTMMTYTVTVTVEELSDEARLLARYDTDGTPGIQAEELREAIRDYLDETLSPTDMRTLIQLYLNG